MISTLNILTIFLTGFVRFYACLIAVIEANDFACTFDDIHGFSHWEMSLYRISACVPSVNFERDKKTKE